MNKILYTALILLLAQYGSAQCLYTDVCPTDTVEICDLSSNDDRLWSALYWFDSVTSVKDLPDGAVNLSFTATDSCPGAALQFRYLLELDLDGDGAPETRIDSDDLPDAGMVLFGNISGAGEARDFDQRPVPANEKYAFALEINGSDTTRTAWVRWNTAQNPGTYIDPQLPYGKHRISWTVSDGQGNSSACSYVFEIKDCKKPTVVCINGLAANIMQTGLISLWASDFLQYTEDNHSTAWNLEIGLVKAAESTGAFPVDGNGDPATMILFSCDEIGAQMVQLWARDAYGNSDYCEVIIVIQDNFNNCAAQAHSAVVCINHWCDGVPFLGASIEINGSNPALPPISYFDSLSLINGCYFYNHIFPFGADYTIIPLSDADPVNGVSVLDMLRIAQHILGIAPLPAPYGIIAADVNRSSSVTTLDIVEIRKLLTGVYTDFPNNTSWRFVDADFVFPNPANPFLSLFPEDVTVINIQDSVKYSAMKAVKIGDVDCSAMPGLTAAPEDRWITGMQLPDRVLETGETADLPLRFDPAGRCLGFQFGLAFDPEALEIVSVSAPALPEWTPDCWAVPAPGRMNVVWASTQGVSGTEVLTIRIKARAPVRLSDVVHLAETGLPALLCDDQMNAAGLYLEFRAQRPGGLDAHAIGAARPNPTAAGFSVPVLLDEPGQVMFRLYNSLGALEYELAEFLPAGAHALDVPAARMRAWGAYYYSVQAGKWQDTGVVMKQAP